MMMLLVLRTTAKSPAKALTPTNLFLVVRNLYVHKHTDTLTHLLNQ